MVPTAVLASGEGTNLQAVIEAVQAGRLPLDLRLVVSNRARAFALQRAARGAALAVLVVCANAVAARAGDDSMSSNTSFYDKMLQVIGVQGGANIQYGERSPLVVPPTRDLPPPAADRPPPGQPPKQSG